MGEYKWQGGVGSKGDKQVWDVRDPPPTPGVQKIAPKSLKIQEIGVILACVHACNGLKLKEMQGAVRGTGYLDG
jgi:hypothetical protein